MGFNPIDDRTTRLLRFALDGLQLRQQAISGNVANLETPGYRAVDVRFEDTLKRAVTRSDDLPLAVTDVRHFGLTGSDLGGARPVVAASAETTVRNDGNDVDVDAEMAKLAETQITFSALAQLTSIKLAMIRSAISEGRR